MIIITWGFFVVALFLFFCVSCSWSRSITSCSRSWRRRSSWTHATWMWDVLLNVQLYTDRVVIKLYEPNHRIITTTVLLCWLLLMHSDFQQHYILINSLHDTLHPLHFTADRQEKVKVKEPSWEEVNIYIFFLANTSRRIPFHKVFMCQSWVRSAFQRLNSICWALKNELKMSSTAKNCFIII